MKVCKFGGTSMATAQSMTRVAEIIKMDPERKFIVVSAAGKRFKDDIKVTDILYNCYYAVRDYQTCDKAFAPIRERYEEIIKELNLDVDSKVFFDEIEKQIDKERSLDFTLSRGEYISAYLMAKLLGYNFVDAADLIRFASSGGLNSEYTNDKVAIALQDKENAVIPGFYGKDAYGKIKTFSRGGSDITGSIIARGVNADVYENWTDVSGFLACDPRIVKDPVAISELTYAEIRELSYMGAMVLHSDSIMPAQKGNIPINIKNTFKPEDKGTLIVPRDKYIPHGNPVTGIAGKKNFAVITIEKSMMNTEVGFCRKVLTVFENFGIPVEHVPSGIDTLSIVVNSEYIKNGVLNELVCGLRETVQPDYLAVVDNISLIATVGHGISGKAGMAARLLKSLAENNINLRLIDQGSSELNIIIGVDNTDFENSVRAIYNEFFNN